MSTYIKNLSDTRLCDVPEVGGKNASLGEMLSTLSTEGIRVPDGFATTAAAFRYFLDANGLGDKLSGLMNQLDRSTYGNLDAIGEQARQLILGAQLPELLATEITSAYSALAGDSDIAVAVRSSATAEDLPEASFAGQHESYLNIRGAAAVIRAIHMCYASLYTDRAIKYREDEHFAHEKVALSVGIQRMVRSDMACSGVCFTLEPESGFRDIIHIAGVWGLGENIVQGIATPDEFLVFKPMLGKVKNPVIQKNLGAKQFTMVYGDETQPTVNLGTLPNMQDEFVLNDDELVRLAKWAVIIENHYGKPMDIEWAKDGLSGEMYIIQARPETVQSRKNPYLLTTYALTRKGKLLATGEAVGAAIATGKAKILSSPQEIDRVQNGDIIITDITSPDWDPVLKKASAIITNKGGRTSHASIVARELGVPAIVGTGNATTMVKDGSTITVSCCEGSKGFVYEGKAEWKEITTDLQKSSRPSRTKAMMILGDPEKAFELSFYPNDGVGLMRMEFIITEFIKIHPMALVRYGTLTDPDVKKQIAELTHHYPDKREYFIDRLSQGIATIAAAFYPKEVILRTSDFKTNEYANLLGGKDFEPKEENPMLGFRGASRYYNPLYREGFEMECAAIRRVREEMGLTNLKVMIPFCRTVDEGEKVVATMEEYGLEQGKNGLEIYVMAEIPSNVILAEDFAGVFDGFSIGSNDLTQLTLGIDRDSSLVANLFSEQNPAVEKIISQMISKAREAHVKIGLCGQAPSDYPEFARFLVDQGIDSISFNPDALLKGITNIVMAELEMEVIHYQ